MVVSQSEDQATATTRGAGATSRALSLRASVTNVGCSVSPKKPLQRPRNVSDKSLWLTFASSTAPEHDAPVGRLPVWPHRRLRIEPAQRCLLCCRLTLGQQAEDGARTSWMYFAFGRLAFCFIDFSTDARHATLAMPGAEAADECEAGGA